MEPKIDAEVIIMPLFIENNTLAVSTRIILKVPELFPSDEYLPGGAEDGQAHGETNSEIGPGVGADAV